MLSFSKYRKVYKGIKDKKVFFISLTILDVYDKESYNEFVDQI